MTLSVAQRLLFCSLSWLAAADLLSPLCADELGVTVRSAVHSVDLSVVRLRVIGGEQSVDGDKVSSLITTGVVISDAGEILTSEFALQGKPEAILAEDINGNRANAEIIATDFLRRLVLLRVKDGRWKPASVASSESLKIGQWSVAVGRFYTANSSNVSVGIVSALNRIHGLAIQSDAKISPVNYGGPLINLQGQLMGILVPMSPRGQGGSSSGIEWYDSGIGFAIPMEAALRSADRLRTGMDLKPGKLGVKLAANGIHSSNIRIDRVVPNGPAASAGLRRGDVLISANGRMSERMSILEEAVASSYAGDSLQIVVKRGNEELSFTVTLTEDLPSANPAYLGLMSIRPEKNPSPTEGLDLADISKILQNAAPGKPRLERQTPEKSNDEEAVRLLVVNDTAVAKIQLPQSIELAKLNGIPTPDLGVMFTELANVQAGDKVSIDYQLPQNTEIKSAEITSTIRPEKVIRLSTELLNEITRIGQEQLQQNVSGDKPTENADRGDNPPSSQMVSQIERKELSFEERGRAIIFGSSRPTGIVPGLVILISAEKESEDQILTRWKPFIESHLIKLAIPVNPEKSQLTLDDVPLIMTMIQSVAGRSQADLRRIVVVGDREQIPLAWELMLGGPSPIRGIALRNGWVSTSDASSVDGDDKSVLLLESSTTKETQALITQSREALKKAGFWTLLPIDSSSDERTIADWSMLLRSF